MRQIKLAGHLSRAEIEQHYRRANDGVARSQWQIIWLLAQGKSSREVQMVTGYSLDWIRAIARRYNAEGVAGVGDRRHRNPGRPGPISARQQQALKAALAQAQASGERWSGRDVAVWMSQRLGRTVHVQRGYAWLAKLKFSPPVPRPTHQEASAEDQQLFKKSSRKPST
jgi:transposase